jgi:hypothetical protein
MTRPGSWFSIEPILDVTQFKSSPLNQWSRFCTYDEWFIYIKPTLNKRIYTDMTEWPQLGKETFLKTTYSNNIYRCIVVSKGSYGVCKEMLNAAMKKTLKNSSVREYVTIMNERDMPFRFTYNGVQFNVEAQTRKRKGTSKESNATKKLKLN